jgi:hypothetical protein
MGEFELTGAYYNRLTQKSIDDLLNCKNAGKRHTKEKRSSVPTIFFKILQNYA